jgi:hypothetical protein
MASDAESIFWALIGGVEWFGDNERFERVTKRRLSNTGP